MIRCVLRDCSSLTWKLLLFQRRGPSKDQQDIACSSRLSVLLVLLKIFAGRPLYSPLGLASDAAVYVDYLNAVHAHLYEPHGRGACRLYLAELIEMFEQPTGLKYHLQREDYLLDYLPALWNFFLCPARIYPAKPSCVQ